MKIDAFSGFQYRLGRHFGGCGRTASLLLLLLVALAPLAPAACAQGLEAVAIQHLIGEDPQNLGLKASPVPLDSAALAAGSRGQWITIAQFRFTGNTLFASRALAAVLAGDLNRPLAFPDLHALADKVSDFYRAHGARAMVVVPAQDISSRKVTFVVVEALPGKPAMEARYDTKALPAHHLTGTSSRDA